MDHKSDFDVKLEPRGHCDKLGSFTLQVSNKTISKFDFHSLEIFEYCSFIQVTALLGETFFLLSFRFNHRHGQVSISSYTRSLMIDAAEDNNVVGGDPTQVDEANASSEIQ